MYRTKRGIFKGFSTIHGFRQSLEILEHIPLDKGGLPHASSSNPVCLLHLVGKPSVYYVLITRLQPKKKHFLEIFYWCRKSH